VKGREAWLSEDDWFQDDSSDKSFGDDEYFGEPVRLFDEPISSAECDAFF